MEIITILLSGTLEHKDSMGNRGILNAGEVQQMTADTRHKDWLMILQKAKVLRGIFKKNQTIDYQPPPGKGVLQEAKVLPLLIHTEYSVPGFLHLSMVCKILSSQSSSTEQTMRQA